MLLNVSCSDRYTQRRMKRFRRRTNRTKRTQWWDNKCKTRIYNRHYTNIFTSIPNHCPLYFFIHPLHSAVLNLPQFLRLASHLKLVKTIAINLQLRSVMIDLINNHITPLTEVVQTQFTYLHLTINKRHRWVKKRRTLRAHHFWVFQYRQLPLLLFYGRCSFFFHEKKASLTGNTWEAP